MKWNFITGMLKGRPQPATKLMAITPPRTGERTMLGVENLLSSIAVPEPFSLEIAGDAAGVTLLARCRDGSFVRQQVGGRYPQARVSEVAPEDDPLRLAEGEQAWSMSLRLQGPEYLPLRTFRDDDLLDPGSDPLISVIGSLSDLEEGERLVARMKLLSLGPDWSRQHLEKADRRPQPNPSSSPYNAETQIHRNDGVTMAILGLIALPSLMGHIWVQRGETWKAVLLGLGLVAHQEGPLRQQAPGSLAHQGEGLAHRLRGRDGGHRHPVAARHREPGQGVAAQRGLGLPGLRQPRRDQLQGGEDAPHGSGNRAVAAPPWDGPEPECPGGAGGGGPVAPLGGRGRPAHGGPLRGQGAVPLGQGRRRRRSRGGTRWPAGRGRFTSRTTCCAATTSTWPAPAWASPVDAQRLCPLKCQGKMSSK